MSCSKPPSQTAPICKVAICKCCAFPFILQVGLCFYAAIALGFSNNAETPATLQSRGVVYKQTAAGFYTPFAWITCVVLASLPVAIVADIIFGSLLYWITEFVPEVDNFLFFLMTLFFMDVLLAAIFRLMMVSHFLESL